jgi:pimeloyl-ACP methyl ester carboxylesterase
VVDLAHRIEGSEDAPVLLLGGSLGTTLEMWAPQVEGLGDSWRTISFDHRGHGRSPVPDGPYEITDLGGDVLALMDRLGIGRASFCGLSIGGMVGLWLAINAPERIERLILISSAAYLPEAASAYGERAAAVRAAGTAAHDPAIPAEHGRAIADAVPGARWELLDPAAHLASVERAAAVNALITEHLG